MSTESDLLNAALSGGDNDAFRQVYDKYFKQLVRVLEYNKCKHPEDAAQEAFLKLVTTFGTPSGYNDSKGSLFNFLLMIARNKCKDRTKAKKHKLTIAFTDYDSSDSGNSTAASDSVDERNRTSDEIAYEMLVNAALWDCINELDEKARLILELKYVDSFTWVEIAAALDEVRTHGAAAGIGHRALRKVGDCMFNKGFRPGGV